MRLVGTANLTRDPELRYIQSGTAVCDFTVAYSQRSSKDKEYVAFIDCTAWGKQAELINEYFKKGKPIFLVASPRTDSWETDGQKRSKLVFTVESFEFVNSRKKEEDKEEKEEKPVKKYMPEEEEEESIPF